MVSSCLADEEQLSTELASIVRVRNRLAMTPDEKLPKICNVLLPRLLRRFDINIIGLLKADTSAHSHELHTKIQTHLAGTLAHALERLRLLSSEDNEYVVSVMEAGTGLETSPATTLSLSLASVGIAKCGAGNAVAALPHVISCINRLYVAGEEVKLTPAWKLQSRQAAWLWWNAVARSAGLNAICEDRTGAEDTTPWKDLEHMPTATSDSIEAFRQSGMGVMDLLMDILLYWPPSTDLTRGHMHEGDDSMVDNSTGLSIRGLTRIQQSWKGSGCKVTHIRKLQYVCFRYAVWPSNRGILGNSDQARLLCVIVASTGSMHGRLALSLLQDYERQQETYPCSMSLATSLLILLLGDAASAAILDQYSDSRELWEEILGPRPTESSFHRAPLPLHAASTIVEFLRKHVGPSFASRNRGMELYMDLVTALQASCQHTLYFGIELMEGLYGKSKCSTSGVLGDLQDRFRDRCLQTARGVLSSMPETSNEALEPPTRDDQGGWPVGVPMPFGTRHDLNHLLADHRERQKKKRRRLARAVQARRIAYNMIATLISKQSEPRSLDLLVKLSSLVLRCASMEDDGMKPNVSESLEALLSSCIESATRLPYTRGAAPDFYMENLLPSLMVAATSKSIEARLVVIRWSTELFLPANAWVGLLLCRFLADEEDGRVSVAAKETIPKMLLVSSAEPAKPIEVPCLLDTEHPTYHDTIRLYLDDVVSKVARDTELSLGEAAIAISNHRFSYAKTVKAFRGNRTTALEQSGLSNRAGACSSMRMNVQERKALAECAICLRDDVYPSDAYCLSCGHCFCLLCWRSYISDALASGFAAAVNLQCPDHRCFERLTIEDICAIDDCFVDRWTSAMLSAFVQRSDRFQPCPGADCPVVAHLSTPWPATAHCDRCAISFCFLCGATPHQPASCAALQRWNEIFASSSFWVKKNAKPCPSCRVPIEKNQGCSHMQCTQCKFDFCWLCLTPLQRHMEPHHCDRYDPSASGDDEQEQRALFFTDRFQAYDEAEEYNREKISFLTNKRDEILDHIYFLETHHIDCLIGVHETLLKARRFLKYCFVALWNMQDNDPDRPIFESRQETTSELTERLSQLSLAKFEEVYRREGEKGVRQHFRALGFYKNAVGRCLKKLESMK